MDASKRVSQVRGPDQPGSARVYGTRFRLLVCAFGIALIVALLAPPGFENRAQAQSATTREYQIKAAFLYNFIKFVEWPDQIEGGSAIVVGVFGRSGDDAAFESISGKTARGKTISVRRLSSLNEIGRVQVLFVSSSERGRIPAILQALRGSSVLTVGETPGFAQSGGILNFATAGNRVRFEANPDAASRGGLRVNSQLLKLARIVRA